MEELHWDALNPSNITHLKFSQKSSYGDEIMSGDPIPEKLCQHSTCDVADALQKLGHIEGGFLAGLTMWSPQGQSDLVKIAGPVYTVQYVHKDEEVSPDAMPLAGRHYVDQVPPGSVLFISSPPSSISRPRATNALYGGLQSTRAQFLGCAGTIVDGSIRDLAEHQKLGHPVFAKGVGVASPNTVWKVGGVNVRVTYSLRMPTQQSPSTVISSLSPAAATRVEIGALSDSIIIEPGDYIMADVNGVVCIPRAELQKVLQLMPSQVAADELVMEDLKAGRAFAESVKERRMNVIRAEDLT